jgi:formate hydrogenlyase subunit 3/multisubunit Na+/H+ antiporter MnhD subunit
VTAPTLLLAAALALPLGLLASCLSQFMRDRMPALLVFAPLPALAAALLAVGGPPLVLGQGRLYLVFALDQPGAILLGVAALLWMIAGLYAATYMRGTPNAGRFVVCWLMTLTGCLGIFVAADMVSFYLLLALLSLGASGVVIHDQTPQAWRSGGVYIALALFGESCVLMAFVLLAAGSPGDSLLIRDAVAALPLSPWRDLTLALLFVGLGLKAGIVPLHVWMPLAHAAAPIPASAVLSGAVVKVGIIGLIRFLPMATALPAWGFALTAAGMFTALYGVAIGITQSHPKAVLAYSSVSQMGLIVAVLGMGLSDGDASAALSATYYASYHVLVKGTLFLTVGVVAATGTRRIWPVLLIATMLALGLGGLPMTGGSLAKFAVKGPLGDGLAGALAKVSAAGTTLLMLHFVQRLRTFAAQDPGAAAPVGLTMPWLTIALASFVVPWWMYLSVTGGLAGTALSPSGLWPVLVGVVLAFALNRWGEFLPAVPVGDVGCVLAPLERTGAAAGAVLESADTFVRRWEVAGITVVALAILFGWTLFAGTLS